MFQIRTYVALSALALIAIVFFTACKKNKETTNNNTNTTIAPVVKTLDVSDVTAIGVQFHGELVSTGNVNVVSRGFCYGSNTNPLANFGSNTITVDGSGIGTFFSNYNSISPNTTYNFRAFVFANGEYYYGENKTFTTKNEIEVFKDSTVQILTTQAVLQLKIVEYNYFDANGQGFYYSKNANFNIGDNEVTKVFCVNSFENNYALTNLIPNTTYYVRAFALANGREFLSQQYTFKTTGYTGSGGGTVFYDKGFVSDGWRYLEMANNDVQNGNTFQWGCNNTLIALTSIDVGAGKSNTERIISICSSQNVASLARQYVQGNVSDWFLGSKEEHILLAKCFLINGDYWTSSEYQATNSAYYVNFRGNGHDWGSEFKTYSKKVRPIRRY